MYEAIAEQIRQAALDEQKVAMFHYQVLANAQALSDDDPVAFCRRVGVPESYATEFGKMLRLAQVMHQQGASLVRP